MSEFVTGDRVRRIAHPKAKRSTGGVGTVMRVHFAERLRGGRKVVERTVTIVVKWDGHRETTTEGPGWLEHADSE